MPDSPSVVPSETTREEPLTKAEREALAKVCRVVMEDPTTSDDNKAICGVNLQYEATVAQLESRVSELEADRKVLVEGRVWRGVSAGPICTICFRQATKQDIDGDWWPPCEHARRAGIETLQFCMCETCCPPIAKVAAFLSETPDNG